MVAARDSDQRRAGSRGRGVRTEGSRGHRALAAALGGAESTPETRSVSVGDVDADVLYQPGGEKAAQGATGAAGSGEG